VILIVLKKIRSRKEKEGSQSLSGIHIETWKGRMILDHCGDIESLAGTTHSKVKVKLGWFYLDSLLKFATFYLADLSKEEKSDNSSVACHHLQETAQVSWVWRHKTTGSRLEKYFVSGTIFHSIFSF